MNAPFAEPLRALDLTVVVFSIDLFVTGAVDLNLINREWTFTNVVLLSKFECIVFGKMRYRIKLKVRLKAEWGFS